MFAFCCEQHHACFCCFFVAYILDFVILMLLLMDSPEGPINHDLVKAQSREGNVRGAGEKIFSRFGKVVVSAHFYQECVSLFE